MGCRPGGRGAVPFLDGVAERCRVGMAELRGSPCGVTRMASRSLVGCQASFGARRGWVTG